MTYSNFFVLLFINIDILIMKDLKLIQPVMTLSMALFCACSPTEKGNEIALFDNFCYSGNDSVWNVDIDSSSQFLNPILGGFYPDPSICRKGNDYYLVNSSFSYYPGVPIFHSKDLVNWEPIGHVLNRPSQLKLDSIRLSGGIYAPAIQYNHHNDTFYMITTCVDGIGNFLVKTDDPMRGEWSDPIMLPQVGGIDPSLFFDDDGKGYIVNNDAPEGEPQWNGHRAIWIHEFDPATERVTGEAKVIIDGGMDKSKKPVWIEGPHLYKVNDTYYLMAAEGGTGTNHSEVVFSAKSVKGPYTPCKINPILTQRDLPADRLNPITSAGHADIIDTPDGNWWAVFLACRPYEGDLYNTGRETFLLPVEWIEGQPVILQKGKEIPYVVEKQGLVSNTVRLNGNFEEKIEDFSEGLDYRWSFIRTPHSEWWSTAAGNLAIMPQQVSIRDIACPSFISRRQQHLCFSASVDMEYRPSSETDMAGLVCYQNEKYYFVLGRSVRDGKQVIVLEASSGKEDVTLAEIPYESKDVTLFVEGDGGRYSFYYSPIGSIEKYPVYEDADATILSTNRGGGFTGTMIGMYASSKH